MKPRIRIYGMVPVNDHPPNTLRRALQDRFGDLEITQAAYDDPPPPDLAEHDILICFVNNQSSYDARKFLTGVIKEHGAFTYLTTIVVGAETTSDSQPLFILGASRYLAADSTPAEIADRAFSTLQKSWWYGVRQQDLSVLVLDHNDRIVRANQSALDHFGPSLVGTFYLTSIEGSPPGPVSNEHPIAKARSTGSVISEDRLTRNVDGDAQQYFLICSPLHGAGRRIRYVAVLLLDLTRSHRFSDAPLALQKHADWPSLYREIVKHARRLGPERVRLYEYLPEDDTLLMRASTGYAPERAAELENNFRIEVSKDVASQDTKARSTPRLHIHTDLPRDDTELVHYFFGEPPDAEELDKEGVHQWIEVPIQLPPTAPEAEPRFWGKMSIDRGPSGAPFNARDASELGGYATIVGSAIISLMHSRETQQALNIIAESGQQLAATRWEHDAQQQVIDVVLSMYRSATGAHVLLYREHDPESPVPLRQVGNTWFETEELRERFSVPIEVPAEIFAQSFAHFSRSPLSPVPYVVPRPEALNSHLLETVATAGNRDKVRAYLLSIRSEMHIPVYRNQAVVGIVIAVSLHQGAFRDETLRRVQALLFVASSWLEMARRHAGQVWVETVLRKMNDVLPMLSDVPLNNDKAFFAGLATILTAHNGLSWNRAFLFSTFSSPNNTAQLVYAVGGRVNDNAQEYHRYLHDAFANCPEFAELPAFVGHRLKVPAPHWVGETVLYDSLYDDYVERLTDREEPISIPLPAPFGDNADYPSSEVDYPVHWMLSHDYSQAPQFPVPVVISESPGRPCRWLQEMNESYKGILSLGKPLYAFPLWCAYNGCPEPMGFVLLDMQHPAKYPRENMIAATRVVLSLASDLLALRIMNRRLQGWHNALPAIFHGRDLRIVWSEFDSSLASAFKAAEAHCLPSGYRSISYKGTSQQNAPHVYAIRRFEQLRDEMRQRIAQIYLPLSQNPTISDIGAFLQAFVDGCKPLSITLQLSDELRDGFPLACDPLVLKDALQHVVGNSVHAVKSQRVAKKPIIAIRAHLDLSPCDNFSRMLIITVSDNGPGVLKTLKRHLFVMGASTKVPGRGQGAGLPMVRGQLTGFHGDIGLGESSEPQEGACMEFRFGIPHKTERPQAPDGNSNGQLTRSAGETSNSQKENKQ